MSNTPSPNADGDPNPRPLGLPKDAYPYPFLILALIMAPLQPPGAFKDEYQTSIAGISGQFFLLKVTVRVMGMLSDLTLHFPHVICAHHPESIVLINRL